MMRLFLTRAAAGGGDRRRRGASAASSPTDSSPKPGWSSAAAHPAPGTLTATSHGGRHCRDRDDRPDGNIRSARRHRSAGDSRHPARRRLRGPPRRHAPSLGLEGPSAAGEFLGALVRALPGGDSAPRALEPRASAAGARRSSASRWTPAPRCSTTRRQADIQYPLLIGEQPGSQAVRALGMEAVFPFSVFVDARGRIVTLKVGELHADQAALILDRLDDSRSGPDRSGHRAPRDRGGDGEAGAGARPGDARTAGSEAELVPRHSPQKPPVSLKLG